MKRIKYIFKVYISENVSPPWGDDETNPIALSDAKRYCSLLRENLISRGSSIRVYLDKLEIFTYDEMPEDCDLKTTQGFYFLKYQRSEEVEVESDNHIYLPSGKPKKVNWASRNRGNKPVISSTTFRKDMKVYPDNLDPGV
tara:strand:+ start:114 stop:536 length:423 start_codon:yes stop_codon:yes gene_type:complete